MSQSKTYLKFKETRSQEDLETLNSYLKRLSEISSKLNNDALELSDEEENKLYDEDEDLIEDLCTHHRQPRTNMITSLIAGQEMTNTNISMTTTRKNTQSITKN